jgi:glutathione peroxidase
MNLLGFLLGKREPIPPTIYDFKVRSITGQIIDFSAFKGKKILVVNTASMCGNTPQYEGLEQLYKERKDKLIIVAFPSNNFLFQEPGSNKTIADFCDTRYHITFPIAEKTSVRGWNKSPLYHWLTEKKYNGYEDSKVKWNFQKYLINEKGKLVAIFGPTTLPLSDEVVSTIDRI